jgi:rhodanese-related sulfurtransferase
VRKRRILKEVLLLVLLGALAAAISNLARTDGAKLEWVGNFGPAGSSLIPFPAKTTTPPAADPLSEAPHKDPGMIYLTIDGDIATRLHKAGAVFLDARRSEAYKAGHIAGARSIAVWEPDTDAKIAALPGAKVPLDSVIVIYCSGANCTDSERLAQRMALSGFRNLYVYRQGLPDWESRRGPVDRGAAP